MVLFHGIKPAQHHIFSDDYVSTTNNVTRLPTISLNISRDFTQGGYSHKLCPVICVISPQGGGGGGGVAVTEPVFVITMVTELYLLVFIY